MTVRRSGMDSNSQFRFWNGRTTAGRYEYHHRESSSRSFINGTAGSNPFRSGEQSRIPDAVRGEIHLESELCQHRLKTNPPAQAMAGGFPEPTIRSEMGRLSL